MEAWIAIKIKSLRKRIVKLFADINAFHFFISIILLFAISATFLYGISIINHSTVDINDIRYLISAIIQALAAILAITITITLVAVQIASEVYTHKIRNYFIESKDFWFLMSIYSLTILFSSISLQFLSNNAYLSFIPMLVVALFTSCLLELGSFIKNMTSMLSLDKIIDNLLRDINKNSFLAHYKQKEKEIAEEMTPVFAIVINALTRNDYGTASFTIKKIKTFFINELLERIIDKENEFSVSLYISDKIKRISKISIRRDEEEVLDEIISSLGEMGSSASAKKFEKTVDKIIELLIFIGDEAIKKKWHARVENAITHLSIIARANVDNSLAEPAILAAKGLESIGSRMASERKDIGSYALEQMESLIRYCRAKGFSSDISGIVSDCERLKERLR